MDYVDDGGPWVDSSVRGAGSRNGFNPKVCKFYVSNIPLGCRPWDLANAFRGFGEIVGAFIAKKKDKLGKTFGFVIHTRILIDDLMCILKPGIFLFFFIFIYT
ncbi:putative RNA recognition motif domain, nucleotide-binding alpha-beta plait domain superfamily [Helianthus annuus]|nr:putative RNA recognition motif domain, nucleotide-binding alpha-beta plait domain superfamily [Helianthus annuus]